MKSLGSGIAATENPFTEVMGLVTQMYKQTAVAKVKTAAAALYAHTTEHCFLTAIFPAHSSNSEFL